MHLQNVKLSEKLALYQGHLLTLANNFISFPDLYDPNRRAWFEEGTLVMDGRRFTLAIRAPNRDEHIKRTSKGTTFVMYAIIEHPVRKEKLELAIPATAGVQGNLMEGKRGVFEHIDGDEWKAQLVAIVDRPISLIEASLAPFEKLGKAVMNKIESLMDAAEGKLEKSGGATVEQIKAGTASGAGITARPPRSGSVGGLMAGGGIAVAALGSSLAFITSTLSKLNPGQVAQGLGAAILAVMVPSVIIAYVRLRQRDLSRVLEGSEWAVNSGMKLNRAQCRHFTVRPDYPAGSRFLRGWRWWIGWGIALILAGLLIWGIVYSISRFVEPPSP